MIEVKNLTKRYGTHVAVDNLSFSILDGEIVGFLGPNGAGKTTTMNIMTGYLSPTDGTANINGYDILDEPAKAKTNIGYLPDTPPLYNNMLVFEYLLFVADIKKVPVKTQKEHVAEIMETVRITDMKNRLIKNLSKGYRQRVGLAQAMIGTPDVIILDEPTVGLDPKQIIEMRDVIKNLGKKHTVILSSHILSEVSAVCDRVMILNKGKIVASDTPESLSQDLDSNSRILIRTKGETDVITQKLMDAPEIKNAANKGSFEEGTFDIEVIGNDRVDIRETIFHLMAANQFPILLMKNLNLTLEEIFLQITTSEDEKAFLASAPQESLLLDPEKLQPEAEKNPDIAQEEETPVLTADQTALKNQEEGGLK